MIAQPIYPIHALHGELTEEYYCRVLCGRQVIQHKPRKCSEKQRETRKAFARRWAGKHSRDSPSATEVV